MVVSVARHAPSLYAADHCYNVPPDRTEFAIGRGAYLIDVSAVRRLTLNGRQPQLTCYCRR